MMWGSPAMFSFLPRGQCMFLYIYTHICLFISTHVHIQIRAVLSWILCHEAMLALIWASAPTPSPPFWQLWRFCYVAGSPFTWLLPLWVSTHTEELQKDQFPQWRSCLTSAGRTLFSLDVLCCTKVLDSGRAGTCFVLFLLTESTVIRPVIRLAELVRNAKNNVLGRERLTTEDWRMCYVS